MASHGYISNWWLRAFAPLYAVRADAANNANVSCGASFDAGGQRGDSSIGLDRHSRFIAGRHHHNSEFSR